MASFVDAIRKILEKYNTLILYNLSELIKYLKKNEKKKRVLEKNDWSSYKHGKRTQMFLKSDLIKYFRNIARSTNNGGEESNERKNACNNRARWETTRTAWQEGE